MWMFYPQKVNYPPLHKVGQGAMLLHLQALMNVYINIITITIMKWFLCILQFTSQFTSLALLGIISRCFQVQFVEHLITSGLNNWILLSDLTEVWREVVLDSNGPNSLRPQRLASFLSPVFNLWLHLYARLLIIARWQPELQASHVHNWIPN